MVEDWIEQTNMDHKRQTWRIDEDTERCFLYKMHVWWTALLERGEAGFYFYQFRVLSSQLSLSCGIKYITSLKHHVIYMLSLVKINEICP